MDGLTDLAERLAAIAIELSEISAARQKDDWTHAGCVSVRHLAIELRDLIREHARPDPPPALGPSDATGLNAGRPIERLFHTRP